MRMVQDVDSCVLCSSCLIRCSAETKDGPQTILKWMWNDYDSGAYSIYTTMHLYWYTS